MLAEPLQISSKMGNYSVTWCDMADDAYRELFNRCRAAIVDKTVWDIYSNDKDTYGRLDNKILQVASEELKTADSCILQCEELLKIGFRRGEILLAIGGGTIQDLATFTASILYRGIPWIYIPTTLLAQADSCIGGKSSLNLGRWKNQLGNFYPPRHICVVPKYLSSLTDVYFRSGVGEMLKVHLLSGPDMVHLITESVGSIKRDSKVLADAIYRSLVIKAKIIEVDEFDQGHRLILNYGHTFGHALEAATDFSICHGIAITFGVDLANYLAWQLGRITKQDYEEMNTILRHNLRPSDWVEFDYADYFMALRSDKKNKEGRYCFILPRELGTVEPEFVPMEKDIEQEIMKYFRGVKDWLR